MAPLLDADFYANITVEMDNQWKSTHAGKDVKETIKEWLVKYIGEPINEMLRYCQNFLSSNRSQFIILIMLELIMASSIYIFLVLLSGTSWMKS